MTKRNEPGFERILLSEFPSENEDEYRKFLRMTAENFDELLDLIDIPTVADSDIRNIRKCECQIFDRQHLSCEILRNHEKVDRIMHLVAKLSDFWLFHPGFFSLFYNRFYLSSHLCEADSLSTSEALICILAILNVYGSVTKRLRSSSASCECSPQCLPQKAY